MVWRSKQAHCENHFVHFGNSLLVTSSIRHLPNRIPKNIERSFQDKQADHNTSQWIKDRKTHPCAKDAKKTADG